jgi:adenylosuccinate lyase
MTRLWSEAHRYRVWLEVELAATEAWEALGEIPTGTTRTLREAAAARPLDDAFAARVAALEAETRHDIVAFTRALTERFGDAARFIHYGLTSTDVVDTAQNVLLREALSLILEDVRGLLGALKAKAVAYKHTPCIGRTHGVHAEPTTFGLKFLNFYAALTRDVARLERAQEAISVVMLSGSVGTYAHVPPEVEARVAAALGMTPDPVTNQTVARDRHAELMSALAILGTTLERVAVEIRHLQRTEVREAQEGFARGQTGSSSMPHKKNPIATENLTGVARLLRSNLQAALENVALWHERDISHSAPERVLFPDTTTLASYACRRLTRVLEELVVYPEAMARNLDALRGLVYSQRVLHQLLEAGLSRERAYEIVQRASLRSWETGEHLRAVLEADPDNPLAPEALASAFDARWYLRFVDTIYARFGL